MELLNIKAKYRESTGNGPARVLRRMGEIPAVIYGPGKDTVLLSVLTKDLGDILKKAKAGQALLNIEIQNGTLHNRTAMIKELQIHPLSRKLLHVDFYEVSMDRKIKVKIPVVTKGIAKGIDFGGMLQVIRRDIEILCLPVGIPESIEIDITDLNIGDSIHVKDLVLPQGVEIPVDVNYTIVTVLSTKSEEKTVEVEEDSEEEAKAKQETKTGGKE
ncbi:MAG: 50S ribosomal protein L25/general stress protein Ctc [Proteobacteria bacterium]|nr:50S ribosomal protein L25/general stress protein Ctc [Pseudomonadota bacterium]MBU4009184.1 50S ribosomal protein L25/general stress protein Ctc [Pseudomonadota bacterium]MBU4036244.1 50S ribosomal protein L25/general stress protein Ctc [Pseudomonadota bacterium]